MLSYQSPTWVRHVVFSNPTMNLICYRLHLQYESYVLPTCLQHESCVFFDSNTVHIRYLPCVSNMGNICCLYPQHIQILISFFMSHIGCFLYLQHESYKLAFLSSTWVTYIVLFTSDNAICVVYSVSNMSHICCSYF